MKVLFLASLLSIQISSTILAQDYFIDHHNGSDTNIGTQLRPFKTFEKAIQKANALTGSGNIRLKVMPGTYVLHDKLIINPIRVLNDTTRYIIEAFHNPDDEDWKPEKMPVILSISENNSETLFNHSVGLLVASKNVTIRGLKFLGNANQAINYYYPIVKEDSTLASLEVTQCIFIGNKEASIIQGGIWAHGQSNVVNRCVFYECRNAILFFDNVNGFKITNTIVTKSYESAFWWTPNDVPFEFDNNIIIDNANVIVSSRNENPKYSSVLKNSIITNNEGFVGYWSRKEGKVVANKNPGIVISDQEIKVSDYSLLENYDAKLSKLHLHVKNGTGNLLSAGIFKKRS
jgi:hypothetical protein